MKERTMPELLAPAGSPAAAAAALQYGADAVYLGLGRFSARAEAENFTPDELVELVSHARSLTPPRKVYLALNTLVRQDELSDAVRSLFVAAEAGVDGVIVQDLGVARLVRRRFPELKLHASTQVAIHNAEGVRVAEDLGFSRAVLARELTLREISHIVENSRLEIEVFIHGTLCYSYSGLCLFSSIMNGRSGNRGRCVYSCREAAESRDGMLHPFSLKDLALGPRVRDLAAAGVHSLKIEGRKKSPLYVAATVDYYRRLLDGRPAPQDIPAAEARLKTIFARPWTTLFLDSRRNPRVVDALVVGHRGAPVGVVERVAATPAGRGVFFTPSLPLERHDGLQIDIPGDARPYGLPVDNLYLVGKKRLEAVFAAPAGVPVAVTLPEDAPRLSPGLPVYQASSQDVKRSYPIDKVKRGHDGGRLAMDVTVTLSSGRAAAVAKAALPALFAGDAAGPLDASAHAGIDTYPARDAAGTEQAVRGALARTGDSRFALGNVTLVNPENLYCRPGGLNALRRLLVERLEEAYQSRRERALATLTAFPEDASSDAAGGAADWILAVDTLDSLSAFTPDDFAGVREVVVSLFPESPSLQDMAAGDSRLPPLRFGLPVILREDAAAALRRRVAELLAAGQRRWLVANPGALDLLGRGGDLDLAGDWPLYVMNREAARLFREAGLTSFTLSPEDERENVRSLLRHAGDAARVVVYAHLPLFLSAVCPTLQIGRCRNDGDGDERCRRCRQNSSLRLEKTGNIDVIAGPNGVATLGPAPFSLCRHLDELKSMGAKHLQIDWRWRSLPPAEAVRLWRSIRGGGKVEGTEGNFTRGLA